MDENKQKPTIGSLFAGIGGFDLAFKWAGWHTAWRVEINPFCQQILELRDPGVPTFGDVRECSGRTYLLPMRRHYLSDVDAVVGGFPCQDISTAGKGAGIRLGVRSGLWFHMRRIIGELRPRLILLENVPAITTRDGTIVAGHIAEMGYGAKWAIIPALATGTPQERERWWCMAYPNQDREIIDRFIGSLPDQYRNAEIQKGEKIQQQLLDIISGGQVLAHSSGTRLAKWGQNKQQKSKQEAQTGMVTKSQ